jgi:SAM-dependent methyltransferase
MADPPSFQTPPYIEPLLQEWESITNKQPDEAFLHLGHWEHPPLVSSPEELRKGQRTLNARLLSMANIHNKLRVLDIGCGLGATLAGLMTQFQELDLIGVNCDPQQLRIAERWQPPIGTNLQWLLADGCSVPLADHSVDRVLVIEALFHFSSRKLFFQEAFRLLRPGGILVVSDFVPSPDLQEFATKSWSFQALEALLLDGLGPWPDLLGSEGLFVDLAQAAGLELQERHNATQATLPSFGCFLNHLPKRLVNLNTMNRAVKVLHWLQSHDLLTMEYFSFRSSKI